MKRALALLAVAASLLIGVSPVAAAETNHYTDRGSGLVALWTTIPYDQEVIPAGDYWEVYVDASTYVAKGDTTYLSGLCVDYWQVTVDEDGNVSGSTDEWGCDTASVLAVDKKLGAGHVEGTIQFQDCLVWDDMKGCTEFGDTHTFVVDVAVSGYGPVSRSHSTGSGGTAGLYQYVSHGVETNRAGTPSGSVKLDGAEITTGAKVTDGMLFNSKSGAVEIIVCKPVTGC